MYKFARQQGGTFLGFIIGLVLGLGIALTVAVVMTKRPMPFISRLARPEKAAPLTPGELADPNKPLYGTHAPAKDPIQELLDRRDKPAPAESAAQPASGRPPVIELSTHEDRPKPPVLHPFGSAAAGTKDAAPAAAAPAAAKVASAAPADDGKWTYYLQVGAFRNRSEAENLRGKLALVGVDASISQRPSDNGPLFRVRSGPFSHREALNQVRHKLAENSIDAAVVRVAKP